MTTAVDLKQRPAVVRRDKRGSRRPTFQTSSAVVRQNCLERSGQLWAAEHRGKLNTESNPAAHLQLMSSSTIKKKDNEKIILKDYTSRKNHKPGALSGS